MSLVSLRLLQPLRRTLCTNVAPKRICVVGSGPAGFYTAQQLLKAREDIVVDILDRSPAPFGLVRYGVAPDHPEVKNVINQFTALARRGRCNFYGNVDVGGVVPLQLLRQAYHGVVLAYGAASDRKLGVPGEDLANMLSAQQFVGWYNGVPENADLPIDLSAETAVVFGHGNVALDVARILLLPHAMLRVTDITGHALERLKNSRVRKVFLVGRRGPMQVSFTIKELREMISLAGSRPVMHTEDFQPVKSQLDTLPRPQKRLLKLLCDTCLERPTAEEEQRRAQTAREWELQFLRSPVEILGNNGRVSGVRLAVNELSADQSAVPTGRFEEIKCGLVLRSIGYKGRALDPTLPFDALRGVIPNDNGRVLSGVGESTVEPGLYCSGWIKRGPSGVILNTMSDAFETADTILQDIRDGAVPCSDSKPGFPCVAELLSENGKKFVSFDQWDHLNEVEVSRGRAVGKPREKVVDLNEMIEVTSESNNLTAHGN